MHALNLIERDLAENMSDAPNPAQQTNVSSSHMQKGSAAELAVYFQQQTGCNNDDALKYAIHYFDYPVLVGHEPKEFLLKLALEDGLYISEHCREQLPFIFDFYSPWIPDRIQNKWELKAPSGWNSKLSIAEDQLYPQMIYGRRLHWSKKTMEKAANDAIIELAEKVNLKRADLIFRGMQSGELLANIRNRWLTMSERNDESEFGRGLYLTRSLSIACDYASSKTAAIAVFNWSDQGGQEVFKRTHFFHGNNDQDWATFVKRNVCWNKSGCKMNLNTCFIPPTDTAVITGAISINHSKILTCSMPVKGPHEQICIKDQPGFRELARRFVGFICFE